MAIAAEPERWAKVRRKLELEGDILKRPPRGFDPNHRFIEDIKRKDFVASVAHEGAGVRPQAHAGLRRRAPDDAAAGRVHHEGAGAGAVGGAGFPGRSIPCFQVLCDGTELRRIRGFRGLGGPTR